jgi:hypothetical protein
MITKPSMELILILKIIGQKSSHTVKKVIN